MAYQTKYPYTNEILKEFPSHTDEQVAEALDRAHKLYQTWRKEDHLGERKAQLKKIAEALRHNADDYAEVMTKDMGKLIGEAKAEVGLCAMIADYFADQAEAFLKPIPFASAAGDAYVLRQSTGVILAVEPWNFPFYQVMRVFAPNFIVGNPMLLKHASICPASAEAFEVLVTESGAAEGAFTNLFINYDQVNTIIQDSRVSGVCLTGSERGGATIAEEAGRNLKKSTLELGGNDPFLILDDADLDAIEGIIAKARLMNSGQVCTSSKRFIVTEKNYDRVVKMTVKAFRNMKWGDPMDPKTTLAPLSSEKAKKDVLEQIQTAIDHGATLEYGNEVIDHPGNFVAPTVLTGITKDNPLYDKEIFGPVAVIYKVKDEEEAVALANDSSYGLGSTIFSADEDHAREVAARIETGMSFINSAWTSLPEIPFGGVKNSGYGRELSELGFTAFVNEHLVFTPRKK